MKLSYSNLYHHFRNTSVFDKKPLLSSRPVELISQTYYCKSLKWPNSVNLQIRPNRTFSNGKDIYVGQEMNILTKCFLLFAHQSKTLVTESEKPVFATVTKRDEGGYRLWPSCKAPSSTDKLWSSLPVASGKLQTDAR